MNLQEIKDQVAKDMGFDLNTDVYKIHFSEYTNEIAQRYATECVKASLEKAANKTSYEWATSMSQEEGMKLTVKNPDNIVLL